MLCEEGLEVGVHPIIRDAILKDDAACCRWVCMAGIRRGDLHYNTSCSDIVRGNFNPFTYQRVEAVGVFGWGRDGLEAASPVGYVMGLWVGGEAHG